MAPNELFQYSLALSLMDGVADQGLPISEFLKHGNHGLGTFRHMNGEMIVLDGKAYQMLSNGSIVDLDPNGDAIHPFAQITRFKPETTTKAVIPSKDKLTGILSDLLYVSSFLQVWPLLCHSYGRPCSRLSLLRLSAPAGSTWRTSTDQISQTGFQKPHTGHATRRLVQVCHCPDGWRTDKAA